MATATLHKFGNFPPELRLKVWHIFLEDEARSRRVLLWDGRVMPFAHLASPLLRVNVETRETALKFYSTKVDIYSLPDTGEFFPLNEDRLRQLLTEIRDSEDEIQMAEVGEAEIADALAEKAHDLLESSQMIAPTKGALYFNPERDTILHGYNCGVHLFVRKISDIFQGLENPAPLWLNFSSKVPTSAFQIAKHVLHVEAPHLCRKSLEKSFLKRASDPLDIVRYAYTSLLYGMDMDMDMAHPILRLGEKESEDLMSQLSNSAKPVRGSLETWYGWSELTEGGKLIIALLRLEDLIDELEGFMSTVTGRFGDRLDANVESGELSTSSEEYKGLKKDLQTIQSSASRCLRSMKDCNTNICAPWRERWA